MWEIKSAPSIGPDVNHHQFQKKSLISSTLIIFDTFFEIRSLLDPITTENNAWHDYDCFLEESVAIFCYRFHIRLTIHFS